MLQHMVQVNIVQRCDLPAYLVPSSIYQFVSRSERMMAVKNDASQLLMEAYKATDGNLDQIYHVTQARVTCGLSQSCIDTALIYLTDHGILRVRGIGGAVSLTIRGIDQVEQLYPNSEREADRLCFLKKSYDLAEANPRVLLNFWTVGDDLGWDRERTLTAYRYLSTKDLLRGKAIGGHYGVTSRCIEIIEKVDVDPRRLADYFPPSATLSINIYKSFNHATVVNSNIASPFATVILEQTEVGMGDTYKGEQVGAMGPNAHAHDMTFNRIWNNDQGQVDLPTLANQLSQLRSAVKVEPSAPDSDATDRAVGILLSAEDAAKEGDGPSALRHLAGLGNWVLEVASKIGVEVAAKAIGISVGVG